MIELGNSYMDFKLKVSMGLIPGYSWVDKFGSNPDVDTATVPETLWEFGGVYQWGNDTGETLYVSSSSALDTQLIEFYTYTIDGLGNWNLEVFEQTINGQTKTDLAPPSGNPIVRIHRTENMADAGGDIIGTVYVYQDTTVTAGVPDDLTKVLSGIINGANQSKQLTYTIPTGYVGFLFRGEAGVTKAVGTNEADFAYRSRRQGKVFKEKKDFGVMTDGSNFYVDVRTFPDPVPAKVDLEMRVTNVSANNMAAWGTFDILLVEEEYLSDAYLTAIGQERRVT